MKAAYTQRPTVIGKYTANSILYRWNIKEVESTSPDSEGVFECDEVMVNQPITPNRITEAVIHELWPQSYEQKLCNEYNAVMLNLVDDEEEANSRVEAYRNFLIQRAKIKKQIDADCAELSIYEL